MVDLVGYSELGMSNVAFGQGLINCGGRETKFQSGVKDCRKIWTYLDKDYRYSIWTDEGFEYCKTLTKIGI